MSLFSKDEHQGAIMCYYNIQGMTPSLPPLWDWAEQKGYFFLMNMGFKTGRGFHQGLHWTDHWTRIAELFLCYRYLTA